MGVYVMDDKQKEDGYKALALALSKNNKEHRITVPLKLWISENPDVFSYNELELDYLNKFLIPYDLKVTSEDENPDGQRMKIKSRFWTYFDLRSLENIIIAYVAFKANGELIMYDPPKD